MAINSIVDIDEMIDDKLLLQQPMSTASMGDGQATASPGYYGPKTQKRELLSPDVKNYLMDKFPNLSPDTIDTIVGKPYGVRDRYLNLNPIDAVRDLIRFGTPGDQPLKKEQQAFGLNVGELFSPRTAEIDAAERAGIDVDKGAPYQVQKDAAYLPADQRDRGIKVLLKEAYPNAPLADLNVQLEPRTNRVIYTDPETGGKQFVSPPGIDWPDVTAVMEPLSLEIALGLGGFAYGSSVGPVQGGVVGGGLGLAATTAMTDSGFFQVAGAAAGATAGALSAPLTFTVGGETMGHFFWRYQNLKGLKERGVLDETYTPDKIMQTAMDDSKVVGAWSLGGNAAFATFAKFMGANPISIGVDKETFVNAWETTQDIKRTGTKVQADVIDTLTTPQVMGVSDVGTTGQRGILQREVDLSVDSAVDVERAMIGQENIIRRGYDEIFEETGIDPNGLDLGDPVVLKQSFGNRIINDIDLEDLKDLPTDEKALANKLKNARDSNEPEALFDAIWRDGRISNTETLLKVFPEESIGDFQKLIYRDFVEKGSSDPVAITQYLRKHGEGLKVVFGDEFVDGLKTYNKIIKDINIESVGGQIGDDELMKITTGLARAYVGIFTRPGRVITALNQVRRSVRKGSFEEMILDPEKLYKRIQRGEFLENQAFMTSARALGRYYGQEDGGTSKAEPDQPSALPVATPDVSIDLEGLEMNRGGSPLIELKYNY
tara:strand:+ start:1900 stop:4047 length:2148 start_codon:yes stop_codon:yes gene_type:complete